MHPARIAELLEPFLPASSANDRRPTVNDALYQHISTYIDILLRWNTRINLTAVRDPEQIVARHFGESLFAARHLFPTTNPLETAALGRPAERSSAVSPTRAAERRQNAAHGASRGSAPPEKRAPEGRKTHPARTPALPPEGFTLDQRLTADDSVTDVGSGAGFPGIPIKLWAPHIPLTLIESNHKKATFLREIVRALTLTNVNVFRGRAEELLQGEPALPGSEGQAKPPQTEDNSQRPLPTGRGFALVTLRAVERFANVLPIAASLVSPGGRLALLIGASQLSQAQAILPSFSWDAPLSVPQSSSRTLLIGYHPSSREDT